MFIYLDNAATTRVSDAALDAIEAEWPYADIIINAVPPVDKLRRNTGITMQTIDAFNQALAELASELGYHFLNSSEALKDPETGFAKTAEQMSANKAMKALSDFLRPEFLGRVDEVIAFKPLSEESLERIAALVLDEYVQPLADKGVAFTYTPAACKALVAEAGAKFGARDLRRTIRKKVEDPLAERFVAGTLTGAVKLDAPEGRLELM